MKTCKICKNIIPKEVGQYNRTKYCSALCNKIGQKAITDEVIRKKRMKDPTYGKVPKPLNEYQNARLVNDISNILDLILEHIYSIKRK